MNTSLQILLCIAVIIFAAKLAGALTARCGLPLVLGELLAGVLLGPTFLNIWSLSWLAQTASADTVSVANVFKVLAEIGVVLLMFVAGLETDVEMMRSTLAPAFWTAAGGVILPDGGRHSSLAQRWLCLARGNFHRYDSHRHQRHHHGANSPEPQAAAFESGVYDSRSSCYR